MADYPGGPKPLKPKTNDTPSNTNFSGPSVPVVQPNPFGSSQSKDSYAPKTTPVVPKKK